MPAGPGDVVGVIGRKISRTITGEGACFAVPTYPKIIGNNPRTAERHRGTEIAMVGQAPVRVIGPVRHHQYVVPSGRNDGARRWRWTRRR